MTYKAAFLSKEVLREKAAEFLDKYNPNREIPVLIEKIVEFDFGLDIVPVPGLQYSFDVVAYSTKNQREIRVDKYIYESREARYRFSLAHELGHVVLHPGLFEHLDFHDISSWKEAITDSVSEEQYGYVEYHANCFAGLVLVPPTELENVFLQCRQKSKKRGLDLDGDDDGVRDIIEGYIAREFLVSAAVVHRRMEFDGLWERPNKSIQA